MRVHWKSVPLALAVLVSIGCGGSSSGGSGPAPAPGPNDWPMELVNQSGNPLNVYVIEPGGGRGPHLGIAHGGRTTNFTVPYQAQGFALLMEDEVEDRRFTSESVLPTPGAALVVTVSAMFDVQIRLRDGG